MQTLVVSVSRAASLSTSRSLKQLQRDRVRMALKIAGPRYTPRLNVNVPIASVFDGLGRTPAFFDRIRHIHGEIQRAYSRCLPKSQDIAREQYKALSDAIVPIFSFFRRATRAGDGHIAFSALSEDVKRTVEAIWQCVSELQRVNDERKKQASDPHETMPGASEGFSSERHYLFELRSAVETLGSLAESTDAQAANVGAFFLHGLAGTGKTHLFCDIAAHRIRAGLPTFLFLGEEFTDDDPWTVIGQLLGMTSGTPRLLQTFDQLERRKRARTLIMIDALNEAQVRVKWRSLLEAKLCKYVAIAVSVRTGFERQVLPPSALRQFVGDEHRGFEFREWEAVTKFFAAFRIPLPEVPLLTPEFQNPLFLMLFCRGIQSRQSRRGKQAFRGHEGSTYIFEQFVKKGADAVAKQFGLSPGRDRKGDYVIWDTVIDRIAERMAHQRGVGSRISERAVLQIIGHAHPTVDSRNLLRALERQLLLTRVPRYSRHFGQAGYEYRFPFQKFSDHLVVRHLLKQHLKDPKRSFRPPSRLGRIVLSGWNRGLIEALAVQVPERLKGTELVTVAPSEFAQSPLAVETFLESLVWRAPDAFKLDEAIAYINQHVIRTEWGHRQFLDALLTVATVPEHLLNADGLHRHLSQFTMPARDSWWLPFLQYQYGTNQAVDRLIAWAWEGGDKSHIGPKALELAAVALSWFLASSNRFLRDRATKALVALLTDRLEIVTLLVERFHDVNDPYVAGRVYAVAYGCALRSLNRSGLSLLAQKVYERAFSNDRPPPDMLLRDYARGVIETARHHGYRFKAPRPFRPPYKSAWPRRVPSEKALRAKYYELHQQCGYLWFSVIASGDFDRYVIQPAFGHFSSRRLGVPHAPSRKERYEAFKLSLTPPQRRLWDKREGGIAASLVASLIETEGDDVRRQAKATERRLRRSERAFLRSLGTDQRHLYNEVVVPCEKDDRDEFRFDVNFACRWIYQRVFTLGWKPELFGNFDTEMGRYDRGRDARKSERVGKKYQWIALHELLARASDNFEFRDDVSSSAKGHYEGPWQLSERDIDPSSVLRTTGGRRGDEEDCWWLRARYDAWARRSSDVAWIKRVDDIPRPPRLIQVRDRSGIDFLVLEGSFQWEQGTPPEREKYDRESRNLWLMVKSYLVKRDDVETLYQWAARQDFFGRWMPESHESYRIFLREFPWAPAFRSIYAPYYSRDEWTDGSRFGDHKLPAKVLITDDEYLKESSTYDCSVDDAIRVKLPAKWIYDRMELRPMAEDGAFTDATGKLVVYDPSVKEDGPGVLLANKSALRAFLSQHDCDIVWTLLGEKGLIGGRIGHGYWPGRLVMSGAYRLDGRGGITGTIIVNLHKPDSNQGRKEQTARRLWRR